jgi:hypothetical protein
MSKHTGKMIVAISGTLPFSFFSELWPVLVPVVRPHFLQGDLTLGKAEDGLAVLGRDRLLAIDPIGDDRLGDTHNMRNGEGSPTLAFDPFIEFHRVIISHGVSVRQ